MLGRQRPFSPSVLQRAGCLLLRPMFMFSSQGESLHCFLVGWCTNKSYVIATSDLWLFIHASNLLPSTPHTTPLQNLALASRIGSRRVTHRRGDSVEELSGGRSSGPDHHQHGRATAVGERSSHRSYHADEFIQEAERILRNFRMEEGTAVEWLIQALEGSARAGGAHPRSSGGRHSGQSFGSPRSHLWRPPGPLCSAHFVPRPAAGDGGECSGVRTAPADADHQAERSAS